MKSKTQLFTRINVIVATLVLTLISGFISYLAAHQEQIVQTPEIQEQVVTKKPIVDHRQPQTSKSTPAQNKVPDTPTPLALNDQKKQEPTTIKSDLVIEGGLVVDQKGNSHPVREYTALYVPNDPQATQWWTTNIDMPVMWSNSPSSYVPTVAVIDSGFALDHQDLVGQWAENSGEQGFTTQEAASDLNCTDQSIPLDMACNNIDDNFNGIIDDENGATTEENISLLNCTDQSIPLDMACNRIDDDGNGYIDDWRGFDFQRNDSSVQAGETNLSGNAAAHGTHVSGLIAASGDNGLGGAGVHWRAKILPLQSLDDDGVGNTLGVYNAIIYAIDAGVDVINMSLGSIFHDPFVQSAVEQAHAAGIVVVAASGNDGCECLIYPAAYESVLAVGAHSTNDLRANFSNWGSRLDVMAPGVSMYSTSWSSSNQTARYAVGSGTSYAAPIISGLASYILAQDETLTSQQVVALLTEATDKYSAQAFSTQYGYGNTDAARIVARLSTPNIDQVAYTYSSLSYGQYYPDETFVNLPIYDCQQVGRLPNVPVFYIQSVDGTEEYFSIDPIFAENAFRSPGYTAETVFYGCPLMPWDEPQSVRLLELFSELNDKSFKDSL